MYRCITDVSSCIADVSLYRPGRKRVLRYIKPIHYTAAVSSCIGAVSELYQRYIKWNNASEFDVTITISNLKTIYRQTLEDKPCQDVCYGAPFFTRKKIQLRNCAKQRVLVRYIRKNDTSNPIHYTALYISYTSAIQQIPLYPLHALETGGVVSIHQTLAVSADVSIQPDTSKLMYRHPSGNLYLAVPCALRVLICMGERWVC